MAVASNQIKPIMRTLSMAKKCETEVGIETNGGNKIKNVEVVDIATEERKKQ